MRKMSTSLPRGWKRYKTQEDAQVTLWLENVRTGSILSVVPWGSRDPNDVAIRASSVFGRVEIPGHKQLVMDKSPKEIYEIASRAHKRRFGKVL